MLRTLHNMPSHKIIKGGLPYNRDLVIYTKVTNHQQLVHKKALNLSYPWTFIPLLNLGSFHHNLIFTVKWQLQPQQAATAFGTTEQAGQQKLVPLRRCRRRRRRRRRATGIISIDNNTVDTVEIALC